MDERECEVLEVPTVCKKCGGKVNPMGTCPEYRCEACGKVYYYVGEKEADCMK